MKKVKTKHRSESGITLIALLVMIILIVILAAVAIKGLTGNERNIKHCPNNSKRLSNCSK